MLGLNVCEIATVVGQPGVHPDHKTDGQPQMLTSSHLSEGSMLRITRGTSYADRLRAYKIRIDGKTVGTIRAKETKDISIVPGEHDVVITIDWARSNIVKISAMEGKVVEMECGSNLVGWRLMLILVYVTFLRHKYLWLRTIT